MAGSVQGGRRRMPWQQRRNRWVYALLVFVGAPLMAGLIGKAYLAGQVRELRAKLHALGYESDNSFWDRPDREALGHFDSPFAAAQAALLPLTEEERDRLPAISKLAGDLERLDPEITEERELVSAILERNRPALSLFEDVLREPAHWPEMTASEFRNFWRYEATDLLEYYRLDLGVALEAGDRARLADGIETVCWLIKGGVQRQTLSQIGSWAETLAVPLLQRLSRDRALDEGQLARLAAILEQTHTEDALRSETRILIETAMVNLDEIVPRIPAPFSIVGLTDYQVSKSLELILHAAEQFQHNPEQWWGSVSTQSQGMLENSGPFFLNVVPYQTARSLTDGLARALRGHFNVQALKMVIAVERFRFAQGVLPDSLEALTPEYLAGVPIGPIDGVSLRIEAAEGGYTVYGAGIAQRSRRPGRSISPARWGIVMKLGGDSAESAAG